MYTGINQYLNIIIRNRCPAGDARLLIIFGRTSQLGRGRLHGLLILKPLESVLHPNNISLRNKRAIDSWTSVPIMVIHKLVSALFAVLIKFILVIQSKNLIQNHGSFVCYLLDLQYKTFTKIEAFRLLVMESEMIISCQLYRS
jgi:hypothetical protein